MPWPLVLSSATHTQVKSIYLYKSMRNLYRCAVVEQLPWPLVLSSATHTQGKSVYLYKSMRNLHRYADAIRCHDLRYWKSFIEQITESHHKLRYRSLSKDGPWVSIRTALLHTAVNKFLTMDRVALRSTFDTLTCGPDGHISEATCFDRDDREFVKPRQHHSSKAMQQPNVVCHVRSILDVATCRSNYYTFFDSKLAWCHSNLQRSIDPQN